MFIISQAFPHWPKIVWESLHKDGSLPWYCASPVQESYYSGEATPHYPVPALIIEVEYCPICPCWELWTRGRDDRPRYAHASCVEYPEA